MRKRILLASAVGIGAGLAYLLTRAADEKEEDLNRNGGNVGALSDSGESSESQHPKLCRGLLLSLQMVGMPANF